MSVHGELSEWKGPASRKPSFMQPTVENTAWAHAFGCSAGTNENEGFLHPIHTSIHPNPAGRGARRVVTGLEGTITRPILLSNFLHILCYRTSPSSKFQTPTGNGWVCFLTEGGVDVFLRGVGQKIVPDVMLVL